MSGLGSFFGLGVLGNALSTFQQAADVTSDNIANLNTPGASRQVVNIQQMDPIAGSPFASTHFSGTFGNGSIVANIQRIHEDSYDSLFRGASASQNYYTVQQNQLQALQASLGEPSNGINAYFTAFQSAVSQLVDQVGTGSTSSRANVLSSAQALAQALNAASGTLQTQQAQVLQQAGSAVSAVNGILDKIAALNGQIRASTAVGDNPNTYKDQRDHLIDQLSQYLSTQTAIQPDGSTLVTVNGQALVNDTIAYHLAQPTIGVAPTGEPAFKVDFATNPPAAPGAPGIPLGSGQLAAFADLYNNKLTAYGRQLDDFASGLANEVNRITQAGYDQNGVAGTALFQPIVATLPISAGNIRVGITNPSQLPVALASTAAGSLVTNLNSANNTVDTASAMNGDGSMANPPNAGGISGTLTVTVDGVAQTFAYNTNTTDTSIDAFISHFNSLHYGVTASFDASAQRIVFARDPMNTDLVHRAAQGATPTSPAFTITDSNNPAAAGASLLGALGAAGIQGVTQNGTNAFGANDNGAANAMMKMFAANVGVPALQTASAAAIAAGTQTITLPAGVTSVRVGDVITIGATPGGGAPQENVVVSAVSYNPVTGIESFTAAFAGAHAAGASIASAPTQTLGQFYGQIVSQMGVDTQTAITGAQSQTTLSSNIDKVRQGVDGINIDEETQNLIKFQNAYQATARTINVLDSMLGTIINSLGVGH
ncbi:MAG TPA: flagellar hook-associated protein FlgK [Candidatus Baltobacteraceae bacterium]|nr:flagellar hook-associated protein FlgK [Candidatus Baltobacteraceae bacterium]